MGGPHFGKHLSPFQVPAVVEDLSENDLAAPVGAGILGELAHGVSVQRRLTARPDEGVEETFAGVQRRAEIGLMLEAIGRATGDLDYLKFKMEPSGA